MGLAQVEGDDRKEGAFKECLVMFVTLSIGSG